MKEFSFREFFRSAIKVTKYCLCVVLVGALLANLVLDVQQERANKQQRQQVEPYYPLITQTQNGVLLGTNAGYLKLVLDPFTVYRYAPNQQHQYYNINQQGFRSDEPTEKVSKEQRLFLLGGSSAFGTGLLSDEQTLARQLEDDLAMEVINAAVIGYVSDQELVQLVVDVIEYKPNAVLVFDGWNDFEEARVGRNNKRRMRTHSFVESNLERLQEIQYSSFGTRLLVAVELSIFPVLGKKIRSLLKESSVDGNVKERVRWAALAYAENISKMHQVSTSFGAQFYCAMQPDLRSLGAARAASDIEEGKLYDFFREVARQKLKTMGISCLDLNEYAGKLTSEMFMDGIHLNEQGNEFVAKILARNLKN